jgi:hypothetical protein
VVETMKVPLESPLKLHRGVCWDEVRRSNVAVVMRWS